MQLKREVRQMRTGRESTPVGRGLVWGPVLLVIVLVIVAPWLSRRRRLRKLAQAPRRPHYRTWLPRRR